MKWTAAIAIAGAVLVPSGPAAAQGDPFGPIGPSTPPEQQQPAPQPQPTTTSDDGDDGLGLGTSIALGAVALVAIGAVFVAIFHEGRQMDRAKRGSRRRTRADTRGRRPATSRAPAAGGDRRTDAKRPPPPPRKRRPKSKRR
jgi:hypothetical protein